MSNIPSNDSSRIYSYLTAVKDAIREQQSKGFYICVLGPGKGSDYYTVRCKIRDALISNGFKDTIFPEEVIDSTGLTANTITEDYLLREKAHFIISLPLSHGSQVEVGRYAADEKTQNKFSIFIEEKYAIGIVESWRTGELPSYLTGMYVELRVRHIQTFTKTDLDMCDNCGESDLVKQAIKLSQSEALKRAVITPT